ncbi:MAG: hypothetical protein QOC96_153 [Acidobacteriota bacterium]|jgi:hypothetical protein|nr:hypothetical protein [Acidobacteriota bacterium]
MYLDKDQVTLMTRLLKVFFSLPYSTDLDGKDCETLLRIVKDAKGDISKRKELFDLIHEGTGYSVKTLQKQVTATRVDLQEQRLGSVEKIRSLKIKGIGTENEQGELLLDYMRTRIKTEMKRRNIKVAKSAILLKSWDKNRKDYVFRYWEEDFYSYITDLWNKNKAGQIEWVIQGAGLHGRDRTRQETKGNNKGRNIRLIRMHYKHNQIFTDHDIPKDANRIEFSVRKATWEELSDILYPEIETKSSESKSGLLF